LLWVCRYREEIFLTLRRIESKANANKTRHFYQAAASQLLEIKSVFTILCLKGIRLREQNQPSMTKLGIFIASFFKKRPV
jgi:hypothetical protein